MYLALFLFLSYGAVNINLSKVYCVYLKWVATFLNKKAVKKNLGDLYEGHQNTFETWQAGKVDPAPKCGTIKPHPFLVNLYHLPPSCLVPILDFGQIGHGCQRARFWGHFTNTCKSFHQFGEFATGTLGGDEHSGRPQRNLLK